MIQWHNILREALYTGDPRMDRTGVGTHAVFGRILRFNPSDGFPAVTTKKLFFKSVAAELACFCKGHMTLEEFHQEGCNIWDANAAEFGGELGRIYGTQWRDWRSQMWERREDGIETVPDGFIVVDQLEVLVRGLQANPHGRRHLVSAWNPGELDVMCLPPCHVMFQCYVSSGGELSLSVMMRSVDLFIGLPFDIASFALLQRLIARETDLTVGDLVFFLGDAHVYRNHFEQVREVLKRAPRREKPCLILEPEARLFNFNSSQATLENYNPWPVITAPMNA